MRRANSASFVVSSPRAFSQNIRATRMGMRQPKTATLSPIWGKSLGN